MTGPARYSNFVVVRPGPALPAGCLPRHLDGMWFDLAKVPLAYGPHRGVKAVASGRFEVRDDGAVAEVYEVHACDPE